MPAPILSLEQHAKLIEGYRARPGVHNPAARYAGVNQRTAQKYWEIGAPDAPDIRSKPISLILQEEQEAARARLQELEQEVQRQAVELEAQRRAQQSALAQKDATDARVQEAQMIRMARGAATGLLVTLTGLSKGAAKVGTRIAKSLEAYAADPATMSKGDMVDMTRLVGQLTTALRQANDAGRQAMEMERLLLGEPSAIVAHVHLQEVSVDEAERRINAGLRALERAKARGHVVDGKVVTHPSAHTTALPNTTLQRRADESAPGQPVTTH